MKTYAEDVDVHCATCGKFLWTLTAQEEAAQLRVGNPEPTLIECPTAERCGQ